MKIAIQTVGALILLANFVFGGDIHKFIKAVSMDIPDQEILVAEVKKFETSLPRPQLVSELIGELMGASGPVTEVVVNTMLLGMDPFPFEEIKKQLTTDASSTKRAYLLFLLNNGASAPAQVDEVVEFTKSVLDDKGKGIRRYGEARAYSADGLRVCDVAYNVLVTRLPLDPPMMQVDPDNFLPDKRDALILELAERASIRLITENPSAKTNAISPQAPAPKQLSAPKQALEAKPTPTSSEESASSTSLIIIMVSIVVAIGLLFLFWKKRK